MSTTIDFKKFATGHLGLGAPLLEDYQHDVNNMTRSIIEERAKPFREIDVFSRLIMNRIIFLGTAINSEVANVITAQLLYLTSTQPEGEITLYINSPGGHVYDGLAIYDTIQHISAPVITTCVGLAASMGAVLLTSGAAGKRSALPHSRIMIHQPLGGTRGQMEDMEIAVKEIKSLGDDLYNILARHTQKPVETIRKDATRDYWMRAHEAKEYGIIDEVLTPRST